jgi:hypothetical protein
VRGVADGLRRPARLFPMPEAALRLAGTALGGRDLVRRLVGSLEADSARLQRVVGWQAPYPARHALSLTGEWFAKG